MGWCPPAGCTPATAAHTRWQMSWSVGMAWTMGQCAGTWWHLAAKPSKPAPPPHLVQRGVGVEEAGGHRARQAHVAKPQHLQPALHGRLHVQGRSRGVCWYVMGVGCVDIATQRRVCHIRLHRLLSRTDHTVPLSSCAADCSAHLHQHQHLHLQHAPAPACTAGRSRPGCRSAGCHTAQPPAGRAAPPGCVPPHQCHPAGERDKADFADCCEQECGIPPGAPIWNNPSYSWVKSK